MSKAENFVTYAIKIIGENKHASAVMKYADNPTLGYKAWEYLVKANVDIENERDLAAYSLIASNIAKNKITKDGEESLGNALKHCYEAKGAADQAKAKLMRVLSCQGTIELCSVLRYYVPFIESKYAGRLSYSRLLKDVIYFGDKVKTRWASDFFRDSSHKEETANDA